MTVPLAVRALPPVAARAWFTPPRRGADVAHDLPDGAVPISVTVGTRQLRGYRVGDGPLVILAHGWGGSALQMADLAEALAQRGFTSAAVDAPGHGADGQARSDGFQMAATLEALAETFGRPEAVVAHSLGALTAAMAFADTPPPAMVFLAPMLDLDGAFRIFADRAMLLPWTRQALGKRIRRFAGAAWPALTAGSDLELPGTQLLLVHDPADRQAPFETSAALAVKRDHSRLIIAEATGHTGVLRDATTISAVASFLAGAGAAPTSP